MFVDGGGGGCADGSLKAVCAQVRDGAGGSRYWLGLRELFAESGYCLIILFVGCLIGHLFFRVRFLLFDGRE